MTMLSGWKEIASYLRSGVRTVQRWERYEGMPVCRHNHQERGSVYAIPERIDEWWRRRSIQITARIHGEFGENLKQMDELLKRHRQLTAELDEMIRMNQKLLERRKS